MAKPTHIEFLNSSQFSICHEKSKNGVVNLHVKCQLSTQQSKIVKDALQQNYNVVFVNQDEIILPLAKETTVYNVKALNGIVFLGRENIESL